MDRPGYMVPLYPCSGGFMAKCQFDTPLPISLRNLTRTNLITAEWTQPQL